MENTELEKIETAIERGLILIFVSVEDDNFDQICEALDFLTHLLPMGPIEPCTAAI